MILEELSSDLKGKSLLITGGSGFFGKNICEALNLLNQKKNLGMKIYSLARNPIVQEGIHNIVQDVTKPFEFDIKVDFIIHAATPVVSEVLSDESGFEKTLDIIVNGTKNVLDFASKANCSHFLMVSSGAVYGEQPEDITNISEDYATRGLFFDSKSAYGTGKRISELLAIDWGRKTKKHVTIARCFAFSGRYLPVDQYLAIGSFIGEALKNKVINIKGDGSALRSYMDADDLVCWLMTILIRGDSGEAYNVGSDKEISMKELANKIAEKVQGTKVVIQNQNVSTKRSRYIPSIKKAQTELKLELKINLDESIQKMIDFNRGLRNE